MYSCWAHSPHRRNTAAIKLEPMRYILISARIHSHPSISTRCFCSSLNRCLVAAILPICTFENQIHTAHATRSSPSSHPTEHNGLYRRVYHKLIKLIRLSGCIPRGTLSSLLWFFIRCSSEVVACKISFFCVYIILTSIHTRELLFNFFCIDVSLGSSSQFLELVEKAPRNSYWHQLKSSASHTEWNDACKIFDAKIFIFTSLLFYCITKIKKKPATVAVFRYASLPHHSSRDASSTFATSIPFLILATQKYNILSRKRTRNVRAE